MHTFVLSYVLLAILAPRFKGTLSVVPTDGAVVDGGGLANWLEGLAGVGVLSTKSSGLCHKI